MTLRGEIQRTFTALSVTFPSGSPTSNAWVMEGYALGLVGVASGVSGFYLGANVGVAGGALSPLLDGYNSPAGYDVAVSIGTAQQTAARWVPMPGFWFGAAQIQLLAHDGTGSGIPQSSARVCTITLKS